MRRPLRVLWGICEGDRSRRWRAELLLRRLADAALENGSTGSFGRSPATGRSGAECAHRGRGMSYKIVDGLLRRAASGQIGLKAHTFPRLSRRIEESSMDKGFWTFRTRNIGSLEIWWRTLIPDTAGSLSCSPMPDLWRMNSTNIFQIETTHNASGGLFIASGIRDLAGFWKCTMRSVGGHVPICESRASHVVAACALPQDHASCFGTVCSSKTGCCFLDLWRVLGNRAKNNRQRIPPVFRPEKRNQVFQIPAGFAAIRWSESPAEVLPAPILSLCFRFLECRPLLPSVWLW